MFKRLQDFYFRLPAVFRNIYFFTGLGFIVWMLFLDDNNMLIQYRKRKELIALEGKRHFYKEEIQKANQELIELTSNPENQVKFAREHYWMKHDNEDVFVIVRNP